MSVDTAQLESTVWVVCWGAITANMESVSVWYRANTLYRPLEYIVGMEKGKLKKKKKLIHTNNF